MTDNSFNLLGAYATGTLSEFEQGVLFEAALRNDALFAALANEQPLKELLDDPSARAAILRATEEPRFSVQTSVRDWLQKPVAKGLVVVGALLIIAITVQFVREHSVWPLASRLWRLLH